MSLAGHTLRATDSTGNIIAGAHVEVRAEVPGQPLSALYSDRAGTIALGNPFDTDANGKAHFHVVGGAYQVRVYTGASGAPTFEAIDRYVGIGLNSESDSIAQRTQRVFVAAGAVTVDPDDADDIIVEKTVAAATQVNLCDPALRRKSVKIIDGKSDASTNIITITVPAGKKLYGVLNGTTTVDGNGGSVELTPRLDGTGWY